MNTVVRRGGTLCGDNTDFAGMAALIHRIVLARGEKVLILGTGGTSKTAVAVARSLGAAEVYRLSRSGRDGALTYEDAARLHADAGRAHQHDPRRDVSPPSKAAPLPSTPSRISAASWTPSIIPCARTSCCRRARAGSPPRAGSYMLAAQAAYASALFRGCETSQRDIDLAYQTVRREMENIVLIGMPSSGKSTVGRALAERLGKRFADSDALVTERIGMPIADYFAQRGEAAFREREQEAVADLAATGGQVIATGGGAILRPENVTALRRSGRLVFSRPVARKAHRNGGPIPSRPTARPCAAATKSAMTSTRRGWICILTATAPSRRRRSASKRSG